jgi:hypothetical protein
MEHSRIAAPLAAAVLAIGLTACGGGSDGDSPSTPSSSETTREKTSEPTTKAGELTPPGTKLKVGQEATVGWVPPSSYDSTGAQEGIDLKVTVESIEEGTIDDFENVELEGDEQNSTPFYVKVKIKAVDEFKGESDDPDISVDAIDDRGQEQASITFLNEFETCNDESVPTPFEPGDSYESCLAYLMPGGGSIESVEWNDGPSEANDVTPYFDNPIVWE